MNWSWPSGLEGDLPGIVRARLHATVLYFSHNSRGNWSIEGIQCTLCTEGSVDKSLFKMKISVQECVCVWRVRPHNGFVYQNLHMKREIGLQRWHTDEAVAWILQKGILSAHMQYSNPSRPYTSHTWACDSCVTRVGTLCAGPVFWCARDIPTVGSETPNNTACQAQLC